MNGRDNQRRDSVGHRPDSVGQVTLYSLAAEVARLTLVQAKLQRDNLALRQDMDRLSRGTVRVAGTPVRAVQPTRHERDVLEAAIAAEQVDRETVMHRSRVAHVVEARDAVIRRAHDQGLSEAGIARALAMDRSTIRAALRRTAKVGQEGQR